MEHSIKQKERVKTWEEVATSNDTFRRQAKWSGMPPVTFQTHRLYNFVCREGTKDSYQAALDFATGKSGHHLLTFIGEPGTGKTHLVLGIGWHWLEHEMGLVKYYQAESLLDNLRQGYNITDPETQDDFDNLLKWLKEVDLLIIDDIGTENPTEWAVAKLNTIIDHRYLNGNLTVFTTNCSAKALARKRQQRLASRMSEGIMQVLECDDYRHIKARLHKKG